MRRKLVLSVVTAMAALMVASGVALAATISCPNKSGNLCVGTSNKDTMTGRDRADTMRGNAGGDKMSGRGGADAMLGQPGNDAILGQDGPDTLTGGPGTDTIAGGPGKDKLNGGEANDALNGGAADDSYSFRINAWGKDTITDTTTADDNFNTGNFAEFGFPEPLTASVTVHLASSGLRPEVSDAAGTSTVNWSNNAIDGVYVGTKDGATVTGNGLANQLIAKSEAKDTVSGGEGDDWISVSDFSNGDNVDCGEDPGGTDVDRVFVDGGDAYKNCEMTNGQ